MAGLVLDEEIAHISEELHVTTLIGSHCDGVSILLYGRLDDVQTRAVVTQMDDFNTIRLEDPPEDVDRSIVTVKQGGCGDESSRRRHGIHGRHATTHTYSMGRET